MKEFRITLGISVDEFIAYYQGVAREVVAVSSDGKTVRFPAHVLRPYLTYQGVYGDFILHCDERNKFKGIKRAAD